MSGADASIRPQRTLPDAAWLALAAAAGGGMWLLAQGAPGLVALVVLVALAAILATVVYNRPEFGIVALVGAAALDVTGRVTQVAGVVITAYQAAVLLVAAVLLWRVAERRSSIPPTPADLPVLLFLSFCAAAIPAAVQSTTALVAFASLVSSVVLLYLVVIAIDTPAKGTLVVWSVLALVGLFGALAIAERLGIWSIQPFFKVWSYGIRARVTFKDPNIFGSFLAGSLALVLPSVLELRRPMALVAALGCMLAGLAGLAFTFSRGAWVGFAVGALVALLFSRVSPALKIAVVVGVGVAAAVFLVLFVDPTFVQTKLLDVSSNRSFLFRIYMGMSGLRMFADHPMGVGPGNYPFVFPLYRQAFVNPGLVESHTAYVTVLVEAGIVGFLGFMWLILRFLVSTARVALRASRGQLQALAVGSLAGGVALLTQSLTYSLEASKFLWLTLGLGFAAWRIFDMSTEEDPS
jgi:O-antigen ligase